MQMLSWPISGGKAPTTALRAGVQRSAFLVQIKDDRPRLAGLRRSRRAGGATRAFLLTTKQADTVKLPLDFYQLLKVNPGVSRESVTRAYERCARRCSTLCDRY